MASRAAAPGAGGIVPLVVAATVVAVDQATKLAVRSVLGPDQPERTVGVIGSLVALEYAENRGAAFGLFRGRGMAVSLLGIAILVGLVLFYRRRASPSVALAMAVGSIGGGAVGNLIDRFRLGYVIDFIAVGRWPNFNLADSAISVGVVMLAVTTLFDDPPPRRDDPAAGGEAASMHPPSPTGGP